MSAASCWIVAPMLAQQLLGAGSVQLRHGQVMIDPETYCGAPRL
jgi:hypothetical protein